MLSVRKAQNSNHDWDSERQDAGWKGNGIGTPERFNAGEEQLHIH